MELDVKNITEANRDAWNEVMHRYQAAAKEKWDALFMQPGYVCLGNTEVELLRKNDIEGKSVAHLCCNNWIELLSMKNLGAGYCVGIGVKQAR